MVLAEAPLKAKIHWLPKQIPLHPLSPLLTKQLTAATLLLARQAKFFLTGCDCTVCPNGGCRSQRLASASKPVASSGKGLVVASSPRRVCLCRAAREEKKKKKKSGRGRKTFSLQTVKAEMLQAQL